MLRFLPWLKKLFKKTKGKSKIRRKKRGQKGLSFIGFSGSGKSRFLRAVHEVGALQSRTFRVIPHPPGSLDYLRIDDGPTKTLHVIEARTRSGASQQKYMILDYPGDQLIKEGASASPEDPEAAEQTAEQAADIENFLADCKCHLMFVDFSRLHEEEYTRDVLLKYGAIIQRLAEKKKLSIGIVLTKADLIADFGTLKRFHFVPDGYLIKRTKDRETAMRIAIDEAEKHGKQYGEPGLEASWPETVTSAIKRLTELVALFSELGCSIRVFVVSAEDTLRSVGSALRGATDADTGAVTEPIRWSHCVNRPRSVPTILKRVAVFGVIFLVLGFITTSIIGKQGRARSADFDLIHTRLAQVQKLSTPPVTSEASTKGAFTNLETIEETLNDAGRGSIIGMSTNDEDLATLRAKTCEVASSYVSATWDSFLDRLRASQNREGERQLREQSQVFLEELSNSVLRCEEFGSLEKPDWGIERRKREWNTVLNQKFYALADSIAGIAPYDQSACNRRVGQLAADYSRNLHEASGDETVMRTQWVAYAEQACPKEYVPPDPCDPADSLLAQFEDLRENINDAVESGQADDLASGLRREAIRLSRALGPCNRRDVKAARNELRDYINVVDWLGHAGRYRITITRASPDFEFGLFGPGGESDPQLTDSNSAPHTWVRLEKDKYYFFDWSADQGIEIYKKIESDKSPLCSLHSRRDLIEFALGKGEGALLGDHTKLYIYKNNRWRAVRDLFDI